MPGSTAALQPWPATPQAWLWFSLGSTALLELALAARPQGVVLDLQHGLWERLALEAAVGLARPHCPVVLRCADDSASAIGAALDTGAHAVLVPLVERAEQAQAAVRAAHYPPRGIRSGGGLRPLLAPPGGLAGLRALDARTAVGVMIETAAGVEAAEAICATPGLDFVFIGTGDLALSLGGQGAAATRALARACARVRAAAQRAALPCGLFTGDAAAARQRLAEGWSPVVAANDIQLAAGGFADAVAHTRKPLRTPRRRAGAGKKAD